MRVKSNLKNKKKEKIFLKKNKNIYMKKILYTLNLFLKKYKILLFNILNL